MRLEEFINPGKEYRPSPFWSWNNRLDPEELRWQVREFADKGFGGYFMHSRVGLATPYLSDEWMECIGACLEEGRRVDVESWLYDEDKWPSGFAGGMVPAKGDEYRSKKLVMKRLKREGLEEAIADPSNIAVFQITFNSDGSIKSSRRVKSSDDVEGEGELFTFKVEVTGKSNWFNGESYVDLLDPKVTEEFLKVTIDRYAEYFQESFGEYMPGIFTDEPNYHSHRSVWPDLPSIPWTMEMPSYFKKVNGYDVTDKLPLIFFDGEGCFKVRYDFWRTLTRRFIESWTIPYSRRCDKYGLKMTGHYLCEDNLIMQTMNIGAAMPHYEYMHVPGIDHLGRNINDPLTLKQCSSVAHQFNRKRILCEIFGCSGHSMTFEDQKWIADFHFALGITFLCPHLSLYTQKGDGKRDYPPTISYHQTYWPYYKLINDYFSRAGYLLSQGRYCADILLLHPISSVWATYRPKQHENHSLQMWRYNDSLDRTLNHLLELHWSFDLGDEMILERHGTVNSKGELKVNVSTYRLIIVPPSLNWSGRTVSLLERFLSSGGRVIFIGETPRLIDGEESSERWKRIISNPNSTHISEDKEELDEAISKIIERPVSVVDEDGEEVSDIYVHHRVEGERHIYFLSNKSRNKTYRVFIRFLERGEVTEWNLLDGSVSKVNSVLSEGRTVIYAVFHPAGSHAYVLDTSKPPPVEGRIEELKPKFYEEKIRLPGRWIFERLHPNSMTIDRCRYAIDDGEWSDEMPIWKIREDVWKLAGLDRYIGIQPWVLIEKNVKPKRRFKLRLLGTFTSEVKAGRVCLVIEKAEMWRLYVNGVEVPTSTGEWHWDKQFSKIDITDHVRVGENIIELECQFNIDVPIEDMYLIGDFGVKKISETEYALSEEPEILMDGSWTEQRYPFYAGVIRYKTKVKIGRVDGEVFLRIPEAKGSLFLVYVNGEGPIPICWHPLEANITRFIREGENEVWIDVVSTLRNTFGPLHNRSEDTWVGPSSFTDEEDWTDSYVFVPYGLLRGAEIIIRRRR